MLSVTVFRSGCKLTYSTAGDVTKFLTSQRPFAQSFDLYLAQVRLSYIRQSFNPGQDSNALL